MFFSSQTAMRIHLSVTVMRPFVQFSLCLFRSHQTGCKHKCRILKVEKKPDPNGKKTDPNGKSPNKKRICTINGLHISFLTSENKYLGRMCTIACAASASHCIPPSAVSGIWMNKQEEFANIHPAFGLNHLWIYPGLARCSDPSRRLLRNPPWLIIQQHINA